MDRLLRRAMVLGLSAVLVACTQGGEVSPTVSDPEEPAGTTTSLELTTTAAPTTSTLPAVPPGVDFLTFAEGAFYISQSGTDSVNPSAVLHLVDGAAAPVTLAIGTGGPVEVTFQLPAETTFNWFGIPEIVPSGGNTAFFGSVTISGSTESADTGFVTLAEAELASGESGKVHAVTPDTTIPVRWLRVRLDGAITGSPRQDDQTAYEFTEIVGKGIQVEPPLSTAFTGAWELAPVDRPDARGERLELTQHGALIVGCLDSFEVRGTVDGSVARATGFDASSGRSTAIVFVADDDGSIAATVSLDNGRFEARAAIPPPRSAGSLCVPPTTLEAVCDTPLYINFEVDSAEIRTGSEAILLDIHRVLNESGTQRATIEGHTSTEGSDEYNRDLSQRRALAVADALVGLGFPAEGLTTVGLGESEPIIFPEGDEAARSINRRVEIVCQ